MEKMKYRYIIGTHTL